MNDFEWKDKGSIRDKDPIIKIVNVLIDQRIQKVEISAEDDWIEFFTDQYLFKFHTYADCCSETWIEDVEDLDNLLGEVVLDIVYRWRKEMIDDKDYLQKESCYNGKNCEMDVYNYGIITRKGECTLDFRNANHGYGYYGGILELASVIDLKSGEKLTGYDYIEKMGY